MRECRVGEVAAGGVQNTLRLAGGSGRIQNEEGILRIHDGRRAGRRLLRHQFVVPQIARCVHRDLRAGAAHDKNMLDALGALDAHGTVDILLERHALAAAQRLVRGNHQSRRAIRNATAQRLGRKACEHHGVDRPDARTGEHGNGDLRNHRQVDRHSVAFLYAERQQRVCALADTGMQLTVADVLRTIRIIRLPDDGGLVAAGLQVAIQAIGGDIELAAVEPAGVEIAFQEARVLDLRELLDPIEAAADSAPESIRVLDRLRVHSFVVGAPDLSRGRKVFRDSV